MIVSLVIYGLINSAILALTAIGFSVTYGISRIANFAHGALYVIGGFTAWILLQRAGLPYALAAPLAIAATAALGVVLYRYVLLRVRGLPLAEVIVTFALGITALEFMRFLGFFGTNFGLAPFTARRLEILGVPVDAQRIMVVAAGLLLGAGLWWFSHRTRMGLSLRAIAQDEEAAMTVGIDADRAATLSVALGAGLAGVAAVLLVPLSFLGAESGGNVLITAIAVCIVGGLGSTMGVIVASLLIGYVQIVSVTVLGPHFQMIVALLAILLTLMIRPSGLFGQQHALEERL